MSTNFKTWLAITDHLCQKALIYLLIQLFYLKLDQLGTLITRKKHPHKLLSFKFQNCSTKVQLNTVTTVAQEQPEFEVQATCF